MAMQNLVSAAITSETKADILAKIAEIRTKLDFLTSMSNQDLQGLFKVGNNFAPFLEKARDSANANPDIMSRVFNLEEFNRDYQLLKDLTAIGNQLKQLSDAVQNTLQAVGSDAMAEALEVYAAVKHNADRIPGLKVAATDMGEFFKKQKPKSASKGA
jgi:hypothetical protein